MLDTSIVGRGQPNKNRTINVEANLLSQRALERNRIREQIRRKALAILAVSVVTAIAAPALYHWSNRAAKEAQQATLIRNQLATQRAAIEKHKLSTQPILKDTEMRHKIETRQGRYTGRLLEFFNSSRLDMVISQLRVEVIGGEMKITARADAKTYGAYEHFIERLQVAAGKENVVPKSTRAGRELGDDSVVFDLVYKVQVQD